MTQYLIQSQIIGPPSIFVDSSTYSNMNLKELKEFVKQTVLSLRGLCFYNLDRTIIIEIIGDSSIKLSYGSKLNSKKAALSPLIPDIIRVMKYSNWGKRKLHDKNTVIGYLNFKCPICIDNSVYHLRISIQLRTDGKFYYNGYALTHRREVCFFTPKNKRAKSKLR